MLFYTHIAFAILLGLYVIDFIPITDITLFFSSLIVFTLVPDIDQTKSIIGKRLKPLSGILSFFGHRGFTHSVLFVVLVYLILSHFSMLIAFAAVLAILSHLILDALTPKGIMPLYPLKYKIKGPFRTNSIIEKMVFIVICAMIIAKFSFP